MVAVEGEMPILLSPCKEEEGGEEEEEEEGVRPSKMEEEEGGGGRVAVGEGTRASRGRPLSKEDLREEGLSGVEEEEEEEEDGMS